MIQFWINSHTFKVQSTTLINVLWSQEILELYKHLIDQTLLPIPDMFFIILRIFMSLC